MVDIIGDAPIGAEALVKDVTDATFEADVINVSREVPVIVDFWAPWCGPCKQLTPALEAAVQAKKGKVRLAKVNVDENQVFASQLRVQSIPAVFAIHNGQPIDGFMGAVTGSEVQAFIDRIVEAAGGNAGLHDALDAADEMLTEGAVADAAQTFAAILQEDPENARAMGGLVRAYIALGDLDNARAFLAGIPPTLASDPAITAAAAELDLRAASAETGEVAQLRAAVQADENDHLARLDLAMALAGANDNEGAIDELLELFRRDREWNEEAAKTQLIKIFDMLGPKDPLAQKGRRRLSSMVFA